LFHYSKSIREPNKLLSEAKRRGITGTNPWQPGETLRHLYYVYNSLSPSSARGADIGSKNGSVSWPFCGNSIKGEE